MAEDPIADPTTALRGIARMSLLAGLCPLIPLPFLDDWTEALVRRRTVRDLLRQRGLEPTPGDVDVLAGVERQAGGCGGCWKGLLLWPLVKLTLYLVRKLLRKALILLAANDAVNAASRLLHDGWLLRAALARGELDVAPGERIDRDAARRVRRAMEDAVEGVDTRPLERAIRRAAAGSRRHLLAAARHLGRWARGERRNVGRDAGAAQRAADELPVDDETGALSGVLDKLVDALWLERGYLERLERRFTAALERLR